jgi:hypothetical protein
MLMKEKAGVPSMVVHGCHPCYSGSEATAKEFTDSLSPKNRSYKRRDCTIGELGRTFHLLTMWSGSFPFS